MPRLPTIVDDQSVVAQAGCCWRGESHRKRSISTPRACFGGPRKNHRILSTIFHLIGDELASKILFVCTDMWEPDLKVIREKCSEALRILDRFHHIVAKMNKALDEIPAGGSRRIASEGGVPVLRN